MKVVSALLVLLTAPAISAKGPKAKSPPATTDGPPTTTTAPPSCISYQTIKIAAAWDWALCDYVKSENVQLEGCADTTDIGKTTCYVEGLVATANKAYNEVGLCVNLVPTVLPDASCIQSGSLYEDLDVTDTSYSGFAYTFNDVVTIEFSNEIDGSHVRHMFAGSDVGTNIGSANVKTLCSPSRSGGTWVRGGKWTYFAHELGHQLGVEGHVKGREANSGDFLMEGFIPSDGVFSDTSKAVMIEYIRTRVDGDGDCL